MNYILKKNNAYRLKILIILDNFYDANSKIHDIYINNTIIGEINIFIKNFDKPYGIITLM